VGEKITTAQMDRMDPKGVSILMAHDAFRICLGGVPKHFTYEQVLLWMKLVK
jgi:hypothetical protein